MLEGGKKEDWGEKKRNGIGTEAEDVDRNYLDFKI